METKNLPAVIQAAISEQKIDLTKVNFLMPTKTFGQIIGEYDKIIIEVIEIDPTDDNDVYEVEKGKFCLKKRPLMAIANALGIIWDPRLTGIIESTEKKARAKATGAMRKPNGEWIPVSDEKTIDDNRKSKDERAMTGAKERVIREFLALKNTYKREELSKPIAFPRVIPNISKMLEHPEFRKVAIEKMIGTITSIFGPQKSSETPQIESPKYKIENGDAKEAEQSSEEPHEVSVPWEMEQKEQESEEEIKNRGMVEELRAGRQKWDKELPKDAKGIIDDLLKQEKPDPATVSSLIDKVNDWETRYTALRGVRK
jgi:hypothetical protein